MTLWVLQWWVTDLSNALSERLFSGRVFHASCLALQWMFSHELYNTHKHPQRSDDRASFEDEETEVQCDLLRREAGGRGEEFRPSSESKPFKWPHGRWSPNPIRCWVPGLMGISETLRATREHIFAFGRSFPSLSLS